MRSFLLFLGKAMLIFVLTVLAFVLVRFAGWIIAGFLAAFAFRKLEYLKHSRVFSADTQRAIFTGMVLVVAAVTNTTANKLLEWHFVEAFQAFLPFNLVLWLMTALLFKAWQPTPGPSFFVVIRRILPSAPAEGTDKGR